MKKKLVKCVLVVLVLAASGVSTYKVVNHDGVGISVLALANVEALAFDGESGTVTIPCVTDEKKECTFTFQTEDGASANATVKKAKSSGN